MTTAKTLLVFSKWRRLRSGRAIRDQLILLAQEFYRMAEDARHRFRAVPDKVSPAYSDVAEPRTATGKS